jgi:hypothetical protein
MIQCADLRRESARRWIRALVSLSIFKLVVEIVAIVVLQGVTWWYYTTDVLVRIEGMAGI